MLRAAQTILPPTDIPPAEAHRAHRNAVLIGGEALWHSMLTSSSIAPANMAVTTLQRSAHTRARHRPDTLGQSLSGSSPGTVPFNEVPDVLGRVRRGDSPAASPMAKQLACFILGDAEFLRSVAQRHPGAPMLQKRCATHNPEPNRVRVSPVTPCARRRSAIVEARLVIVSPGGMGRVQYRGET